MNDTARRLRCTFVGELPNGGKTNPGMVALQHGDVVLITIKEGKWCVDVHRTKAGEIEKVTVNVALAPAATTKEMK